MWAQALKLGSGLPQRHCPWAVGMAGWGAQERVFASADVLNGQERSLPGGLTFRNSWPSMHLQIWQDGKHSCLIPLDNSRKMRPARTQPHAVWYQGTLCPFSSSCTWTQDSAMALPALNHSLASRLKLGSKDSFPDYAKRLSASHPATLTWSCWRTT